MTDESIYESIHFDGEDTAEKLQTSTLAQRKQQQPPPVPARRRNQCKLNRQYAFQENSLYVPGVMSDYEGIVHYKTNDTEESKSSTQKSSKTALTTLNGILAAALPPSSPTFPSPTESSVNERRHQQINHETIDRLNMLFDIQRHQYGNREMASRSDSDVSEANCSVSESDVYEHHDDDVVYRIKQFKDFSRLSKRGSSKAMYSLISV